MKLGLGYSPKDATFPAMGLNVLAPGSQNDPRYSPALNNFQILKGIPSKRLGFWQLGGSLTGDVIGLFEFETLQGVKWFIAITETNQYKLDTTSDPAVWVDISYATPWTGVVENDFLDVFVAIGLNSTDDLSKWVIISNGKDPPLYWDGADDFKLYEPDLQPSFEFYRTGRQFFNRIVLANIATTATYEQAIAWSAVQELEDFTSTGAGELIVPGVKGKFIRAEPLGDRLVLYSEDSIALMTYVGGTVIFSLEVSTNETRIVSGRTVVNLGAFHLFLSQENVFAYDGSRLVRTMGDAIYRQYRNELAVPRIQEAFAFHDSARQQVYFVIPVGDTDHAIYVLDYNLQNLADNKWTRHSYSGMPTSMGTWSRSATLTWDSDWAANTTWDNASAAWDQGSIKEGFPVRVVSIANEVFVADDSVAQDDSTPVDAEWSSIDFTAPQEFLSTNCRWLEIEFEASGTLVDVSYSIDGGRNFTLVESVTLTSDYAQYKLPIDVLSPQIRIKFENKEDTGTLSWRWTRCWFRPGGPS